MRVNNRDRYLRTRKNTLQLAHRQSSVSSRDIGGILKLVRDTPPKPPGECNPKVDKDLEAICLKCLAKKKEERYGSAYGLLADLERYEAGEQTVARRWRRSERAVRWCRRNPLVAGLISVVVLIAALTVFMAVFMALSTAQARKAAQLKEALQSNRFAARDLAKTALLQIRDLSGAIETAADDLTLSRLIEQKNRIELWNYL